MAGRGRWAQTVKVAGSVRAKAGVAFGTIGVLNITAQADALKTMSSSLALIVSWWRFIVGCVFAGLHLNIPDLAKDILIVWSLAIAAADISCRSKYGFSLWRVILPLPAAPPIIDGQLASTHFSKMFRPSLSNLALMTAGLVSWIALGVLIWPLGASMFIALVAAFIFVIILTKYKNPPDYLTYPLLFAILPLMIPFQTALFATLFWSSIRWTAGLVILILAANFLFVHVIDPLAPLLKEIPMAPPPPKTA